jgi:uncharacterized protein
LIAALRPLRWLLALVALCAAAWASAQELLPVPPLTARVIDQTATLSAPQRAALEAKLAAFEAERGTQIAVLLVASTAPEELADYTQRVGDAWKLGRADVGDGVIVVAAMEQRRVRIAVSKALQGAIPDLAARQIIDQQIRPAFRAGDVAGGLNAAVDQLFARIGSEALPAPTPAARGQADSGFQLEELAVFFFVVVPIAGAVLTGIFGRKFGSLLTAGGAGGIGWWFSASLWVAAGAAVAALVLVGIFGIGAAARRLGTRGRSLPHVFGSGGWGGGGGFGSGGGGDFDGGGASGDW